MVHTISLPKNEMSFKYNDSILVANVNDQCMSDWWKKCNAHTTAFNTTKGTMVYSNDSISACKNELHQHNRVSSAVSNSNTIDNCYDNSTTSSSSKGLKSKSCCVKQYGVSKESPLQWNFEEVATWLESVGLGVVVENFTDQEITGDVLLNLNQDSLKELGITTYGRRFEVMSAIDKLRSSQDDLVKTNDKHSSNDNFCQDLYGSVTENLLFNSTKESSTSSSHVSSTSQRRASHKDTSCRVSLPSRIHSNEGTSYCDNNSSLLTRSSTIRSSKRSTIDSTASQRSTIVSGGLLSSSSTPQTLYNQSDQEQINYPEQQGWMYKQSCRYKTWNKRWFVLYGSNLFYFKNPTDSCAKGIHLQGYRILLESNVNSIKRYHFKLHHNNERNFFFYTRTIDDMKMWVQALTKATIMRDIFAPTVSSNIIDTVPLVVAQKMKPRPPSTLMFSTKLNADMQFYHEVMEHSDASEEELHETLLWMEHPDKQGTPPQTLIIRPYTHNSHIQQDVDEYLHCQQQEQQEIESIVDPLQKEVNPVTNTDNRASALLHWINDCLPATTKVHDLSQSMRTGEALIQLLEALTVKTIPRCQKQTSRSMTMLDNIVEAFKFMNHEGFVNNKCTIKDVYCGDEEKIVQLLLDIKAWAEEQNMADLSLLSKKL